MNKRLFALLALVLASSAAYATGDDARHQEMFSKMKQTRVDGIQGRIAILQTTLSCVNAATSHEQMKPCEQQEHQAMEAHKQKQEAAREAMRPAGDKVGGRK